MRVLFLLVLIASQARAEEWQPPTLGETTAMVVVEVLIVADVLQTIDMTRRYDEGFSEVNPLLGRHPSARRVALSGLAGGLGAAGLWLWLPRRARYLVPVIVGILEAATVASNASIGLRIRL